MIYFIALAPIRPALVSTEYTSAYNAVVQTLTISGTNIKNSLELSPAP